VVVGGFVLRRVVVGRFLVRRVVVGRFLFRRLVVGIHPRDVWRFIIGGPWSRLRFRRHRLSGQHGWPPQRGRHLVRRECRGEAVGIGAPSVGLRTRGGFRHGEDLRRVNTLVGDSLW